MCGPHSTQVAARALDKKINEKNQTRIFTNFVLWRIQHRAKFCDKPASGGMHDRHQLLTFTHIPLPSNTSSTKSQFFSSPCPPHIIKKRMMWGSFFFSIFYNRMTEPISANDFSCVAWVWKDDQCVWIMEMWLTSANTRILRSEVQRTPYCLHFVPLLFYLAFRNAFLIKYLNLSAENMTCSD